MKLGTSSVALLLFMSVAACGGDDDGGGGDADAGADGALTLSAAPGSIIVTPGDSVTATATITRSGNDGDVTVTASALPGDLEADPVTIAAGETEAEMVFTAPDDAAQAVGTVELTASADGASSATAELDAVIRGAAGELDLSFGAEGATFVSFDEPNTFVRGMTLQADGKIVLVGQVNGDWGIARLTADGALDDTFGDGGMVIQVFDTGQDMASDVVVTDDDKIIVTGRTSLGFTAVRYDEDGSIDDTYGEEGVAAIGSDGAVSWQLLPSSTGGVILGGDSGTGDLLLVALTDGGVPDEDWGAGGALSVDPGDTDQLYDMRYDAEGRILLAGRQGDVSSVPFVCRVNGDGTLEEGGFGCAAPPTPDSSRTGVGVVPLAGGKIMLLEASGAAALHRFLGTGTLDNSFDFDGTAEYAPAALPSPSSAGLAIDEDGNMLVTGTANIGDGTYHIYVMRLESSGNFDTGFGDEGISSTIDSGLVTHQNGDEILVADDGRILVGGVGSDAMGVMGFFIARFWP